MRGSIADYVEEMIKELDDRAVEFIQLEEQKGKRKKKSEDSVRNFWETIKQINIYVIGVPEGEEKGTEA